MSTSAAAAAVKDVVPAAAPKKGKSFLEIQPYLFGYGFGISLFSPTASLYQLARLNPSVNLTPARGIKLALRILPHQTCLKALQMNLSTPVKENINPWAGFAFVGVLQGTSPSSFASKQVHTNVKRGLRRSLWTVQYILREIAQAAGVRQAQLIRRVSRSWLCCGQRYTLSRHSVQ